LRAVVDPDRAGLSAPFDDPFNAPGNPVIGHQEVHLIPSLSRLKSSGVFSSLNARPSPRRSALKPPWRLKGTAQASRRIPVRKENWIILFSVEIPGIGRGQQTILRR